MKKSKIVPRTADNPFAGQPGLVEEIFAFGFRNPFRFSFDMETGDLYVGNVGQDDIEEVDVVVAGGNYGWNLKEGSFCFDPNGPNPGFAFEADPCPNVPPDLELIDPVAEYNTADDLAKTTRAGRSLAGSSIAATAFPSWSAVTYSGITPSSRRPGSAMKAGCFT